MEVVWVILLVACQIQHARSQATVDFNPQENIPGIGALIGGNDEKPILDRWQFWLGIGLAAAFFIVLVYFVVRGFKNYKKLKEERTQQQQLEQEQEKQKTLQHDIENPLPSPTMESTPKCQRPINVDELARRTGRRRKDLITTHAGHHHHRRSNSLASEATSVSSITLESAAETVKTAL